MNNTAPQNAPVDEEILTVRTERTPNPNSLKYVIGRALITGGSAYFPDSASATDRSPLARRIFTVSGVEAVFIGHDFVTVTRAEGNSWADLNEGIAPALEEFFESGDAALVGKATATVSTTLEKDMASPELAEQIKQLLDEKIRPAVAQDGGDIIYHGMDAEGVVYLEMYGACAGCPSSGLTLSQGVETMLKHHLPEVKEVRAL